MPSLSTMALPRRMGVAALLIAGVAAAAPTVWAGEGPAPFTVRMTGEAEGVGASAKKMAIEAAQQQVIIEVLQSLTNSADLAPFRALLRQASAYIVRYDLLRTDVSGAMTQVEIDAQVREKPLRQDVAAVMLPRLPRHPTVLLLLAEQAEATATPNIGGGPAALALAEGLKKFGFTVAGLESLGGAYDAARLGLVVTGGVEEGARFTRENTYDVVITGAGSVNQVPIRPDSNMLRTHAAVTLRFFSGGDGKMTDDLTAEAAVQSVNPREGGDQALADAANKLVGDTTVALVLAVLARQDKDRVVVSIETPPDAQSVEALAEQLRTMPGVAAAEVVAANGKLARLMLDYKGAMAELADFLNNVVVNEKHIEILRAVGREMSLKFIALPGAKPPSGNP